MKNTHKALILSTLMLAGNSQAEITLNGFASVVGGVATTTPKTDSETYEGYDDNIDFSQDSLFALQASADLADGLSATVQLLARGENDWDPDFEWAYVAYDATDNLRILAGRQRVPFYMYSDFLDVSYAYPWITPPSGVYSVVFDTFDGLGAVYSTSLGSFDTNIHVIYGGNNSDFNAFGEDLEPDFNDLAGVALTLNREWLTLRVGYIQTEMNIEIAALEDLTKPWEDNAPAEIADEVISNIEIERDTGSFLELGFQIDYDNLLIIGEFTQLNLDGTALSNEDSYYVLAGYRFGNKLLHVTYGANDASLDKVTGNVPVGVGLDPLIAGTDAWTDAQSEETNYVTLGLRWDFHDSAALKFEYTSYSDDLDSNNDAGLFRTALVAVF